MATETSSSEVDADEVLLDVRPLIEAGEEPFGTIMQTVASLDGRTLLLVAPFEPTPLQGVLSAQGFTYTSEQVGEAEWRVRFVPGDAAAPAPPVTPPAPEVPAAPATTVDAPADAAASPFTIRRPTTSPTSGAAPSPATSPATPSAPPVGMPMNPTLNVPPAWLPLGFMAAAGAGLVGFGISLMSTAPTAVVFPRSGEVIATAHFAVLAFLSTAVLGALHQFGPVVGGRPLRSIPAGVLTGVLFVPGVWLIPTGFLTGHNGLIQLGGVMATVAVCIAAWNVSDALAATGKGAPIVGLRLAVSYLVVTALFGITYAFDRQHVWFPLYDHRVLAHAHIGLLGWLGLAYVAVAEKLWPMFLLAHRPHAHEGERAVWFLGVGAPLLLVGLLFNWGPVAVIGGAYVVPGLLFHLASLASVIRHRRRGLELLHGFVLTSAVCLVAAIVIGVSAGLLPMAVSTRGRLVTTEVLALILWLALAVLGHAHKIVPFISWNRLRARGIMAGRDGRPLLFSHLVNAPVARVTFVIAAIGTISALAGTLSATPWLVRVAGVSLAVAGAIAVANLVSGPLLMIRWHQRTAAES